MQPFCKSSRRGFSSPDGEFKRCDPGGGVAGALRDRADVHVAVVDQPTFFASVVVAAAGEDGHAPLKRGFNARTIPL